MQRRFSTLVSVIAAALLSATCARNPVTGGLDLVLVDEYDVDSWGYSYAKAYRDHFGVVSDHEIAEYVKGVGARIAKNSHEPGRRFRFDVLNTEIPTALSFPDGSILITSGLLVLMSSEDELACVLAHEVAHVTARHTRADFSRASLLRALAMLAGPFLAAPPGGLADALPDLMMPTYSRGDEREADSLGVGYMAAADFDPACGVLVLLSYERYRERVGHDQGWRFLATHPEPRERYQRLVREHDLRSPSACGESYLERLQGLSGDESRGETYTTADGDLLLPTVSVRIRAPEPRRHPHEQEDEFVVRIDDSRRWQEAFTLFAPDVGVRVEIRGYSERFTIEDGIRWANEWGSGTRRYGPRKIWIRDSPSGDRPSIRLALRRRGKTGWNVEHYQWLETGGRLYRLAARLEDDGWEEALPFLNALADRFEVIGADELEGLPLIFRIALHTVSPGETLEMLEERYSAWAAREIAVYNALDPDEDLEPGRRLKVMRPEASPAGLAEDSPVVTDAAAQYELGVAHYRGVGVAQDYGEAVRWFRRAAEQGHVAAQTRLASAYYRGEGVAQDHGEAVRLYRMSAEAGDAVAQYRLGVAYDEGGGVAKDAAEAASWYRKAAEQAYPPALLYLGLAYGRGRGVVKDVVQAYMWLCLADSAGEPRARKYLDWFEEELSEAEIAEGKQLALEWRRTAVKRKDAARK